MVVVVPFKNSWSEKPEIRKIIINFIKSFFLTDTKCYFVRSLSHINLTFLNVGTLEPNIGNGMFIQFLRLGAK